MPGDAARPHQASLPPAPRNGLVPSLERRRLQAYLLFVAMDGFILLASFSAIAAAYLGPGGDFAGVRQGAEPAFLLLPLFLTIALYNGTYSRAGLTDWRQAGAKAIAALAISAALLNFFAFFAKMNAEFSRVVFTAGIVLTGAVIVAMRRFLARRLTARWGRGAVNRLVIQAGGPKFSLPDSIHIDAREHGLRPDRADPASLNRLSQYLRNMDQIVVSSSRENRAAWAEVLKGTGLHGEVIDEATRAIGAVGVVKHDDIGMSSLLVSNGHLGLRARAMKRVFDLTISLAALIALSPVMMLTAAAIKLQDGGPIFFRQRRMGRGNGFFAIYKFRSMREDDSDGARSASRDDERITPVGRFIRRTSIDELPQLINVVKGDMSLVGPRPHALGSRAGEKLFWQVDRKYWQRHGLRPGITGLAQVRGFRGATDTEGDLSSRLDADLEYLNGWSLMRDVRILLRTVTVLVHERAF
ncbi:sugar transferase [Aurantiacibacter gangjinensis]|uniref:Sugar transferase n=2 Tax=Aurantiacibacter gangjinensis TaxID=502682 RepID=A0A0G9MN87_9SPHN|nr:sugar transferase [Aurantiacibacter gangjinensis]